MGIPPRIIDNLLTIIILFGFGYLIYQNLQGKNPLEKIKERIRNMKGRNNQGGYDYGKTGF